MTTRRDFLRALGAGAAVMTPLGAAACSAGGSPSPSPRPAADRGWEVVPEIPARIKPPVFPNRDLDITRFGAVGDGRTDATQSIGRAIAACVSAGGGRVVVPAGRFATGPIHLRSNVELHVVRDATLLFDRD